MRRDTLGELLDRSCLVRACEDVQGRFLEQLGKTRHVETRFIGTKVGDHRELAVEDVFLPVDVEVNDSLDARDTDPVEGEPDVGFFLLPVREEVHAARLLPNAAGPDGGGHLPDRAFRPRIDQMRGDLSQWDQIESALFDVGMRDFEATEVANEIVAAPAADGDLDAACEAFERFGVELGLELGGDVEEARTADVPDGLGFIIRRNRLDSAAQTQALEGLEDIRLPVAQVRTDADIDGGHPTPLY